jgi:hypothetical protein
VQAIESAAHTTVAEENFGIKSFYLKIGRHVLTPEFGLDQEDPMFRDSPKKAEIFVELANWAAIRVDWIR